MNLIILTNNDPYAGILVYPLLSKRAKDVKAIFIQNGILDSRRGSFKLFIHIMKRAGIKFSFFLSAELIGYKIIIFLRRFFQKNDYENDYVFEIPSHIAKKFNVPVYRLNGSINDSLNLERISMFSPDLIITARYGEILKKPILQIPIKGVINFHPSLLPSYAGLGSIFQAIYHNEEKIGYTIHFMDEGIDTGKIVTQEVIDYSPDDSISRVCLKVYLGGSYGILNSVKKIEDGSTIEILIDHKRSYFSWPDKKHVEELLKSNKKLIQVKDFLFVLMDFPRTLIR